jgi:hypothetical protein
MQFPGGADPEAQFKIVWDQAEDKVSGRVADAVYFI